MDKIEEINQENLQVIESLDWSKFSPAMAKIKQNELEMHLTQINLNKRQIEVIDVQKDATVAMKNATNAIAFFAFIQVVIAIIALCIAMKNTP